MKLNRVTLEWYELLARGLIWAAGIVLLLSIIGAVVIAGSDSAIPILEDAERQGRGILALASLGGGLTSAGVLGGLGAILRLMVTARLAELPAEPERAEPDPPKPTRREREPKEQKRTRRRSRTEAEKGEKPATNEKAQKSDEDEERDGA